MVLRTAAYRSAASTIKYKDLILRNNITNHLRRTLAALAGIILLTAQKTHAADPEYLITDNLAVSIKDGSFSALLAYREGHDYLPQGQPAPIMQVRLISDNGSVKDYPPDSMTWADPGREFTLNYSSIASLPV